MSNLIGWYNGGWGYSSLGRVYHDGTIDFVTGFTSNDTIMIAISITPGTTTGKMWVGVNGTWYDGNPATGTGEQKSNLVDNIFPASSTFSNNMGGTANYGASAFTYSIPSGFSSVDGSQVG